MTQPANFDDVRISDNPARSRYEAHSGGLMAELTYLKRRGEIVLLHTGVPAALEGHGIAGRLAQFALEDARAKGLRVVARCPFVLSYLAKHPEYADLVERPQTTAKE
jgi:predicted GNAT family acetyltransferase